MSGTAAAVPHQKIVPDDVAAVLKRNGIEVQKLLGTGAFSEVFVKSNASQFHCMHARGVCGKVFSLDSFAF